MGYYGLLWASIDNLLLVGPCAPIYGLYGALYCGGDPGSNF